MGRPGDVGGGRPQDVLETNIFKNKKQLSKVFYKKSFYSKFSNINSKTIVLESLFNKFSGL